MLARRSRFRCAGVDLCSPPAAKRDGGTDGYQPDKGEDDQLCPEGNIVNVIVPAFGGERHSRKPDDQDQRGTEAVADVHRTDPPDRRLERKSVVKGKRVSVRVDLGGRRFKKKKKK